MDKMQDPGKEDTMQDGEVMEPTIDDDEEKEEDVEEKHEEEEDTTL